MPPYRCTDEAAGAVAINCAAVSGVCAAWASQMLKTKTLAIVTLAKHLRKTAFMKSPHGRCGFEPGVTD
jgi:hypothetical protein